MTAARASEPRRVVGVVEEVLPSALYRVDAEGHRVVAHVGEGMHRNFVRLLVGDKVVVELSPRDVTRGRIVRRTT
ncbi:MAG: translation initiation factor IF-1 [Vicinamibacterales bacterium]